MISFIKKTISGLSKTRRTLNHIIAGLSGKSYLDKTDLEQLEEALLGADLGWELTENIIESLKVPGQKEISVTERFFHAISKYLEDKADKICMMVVVIYLVIVYQLPFLLFFVILAIRDTFLIIIGVYLMFSQEEVFQSNISGKWFMGISALMMALFMYQQPLHIPAYVLWLSYMISMALFSFSTYEYIRRYLRYFKKLDVR